MATTHHTPAPTPTERPLLITASELARMLGVSTRHIWRLRDSGDLPAAIRLGTAVRWHRPTVESWLVESQRGGRR